MTVIHPPAAKAELESKPTTIDLHDHWLAAFLTWLVPGLGHMYQRRWGKGGLFMVCILGTFFYGLWIGGGRVVYASFREPEFREWRWAYVAQVATGLPALPAVVQSIRTGASPPKAPLFDGLMAPPMLRGQSVPRTWVEEQHQQEIDKNLPPSHYEYALRFFDEFKGRQPPQETYVHYNPSPNDEVSPSSTDQSGHWNLKYGAYYDLGTVFTVIAGLLNVLAIWDAFGGPMIVAPKPSAGKDGEAAPETSK